MPQPGTDYMPDEAVLDEILSSSPDEPLEEIPEKEEAAELEPEKAEEVEEEAPEVEIDYDLKIPMPDGKDAITLGEMKDKVTQLERTEAQYIERENAILREQQTLTAAIQAAGGNVPPELKQQMDAQMMQYQEQQHQLMLQTMPEMADKAGFNQVKERAIKVLEQYGAQDKVANITEAWQVKLINDYGRLLEEKQQAEETLQQVKEASKAKGSRPRAKTKLSSVQQKLEKAKANPLNDAVVMDAIDTLLK